MYASASFLFNFTRIHVLIIIHFKWLKYK